jgi:colanic acid biosynthesis glycosyl transferase WcaI
MATGQYLAEVAVRLVERGHKVTVVTSRRAYDHPEKLFPSHETWRGVTIYRVGSTRFGKTAKWRRAADFASFLVPCALRLAILRRHDAVVALTSPPLISFLGALLARLRGSRFYYWVMDFNPDEAIAAGWLDPESFAGRLLEWMSRFSLREAAGIIALDRFMKDRVAAKLLFERAPRSACSAGCQPAVSPTASRQTETTSLSIELPGRREKEPIASTSAPLPPKPDGKIVVIPPWSHDDDVTYDPAGRQRFRKAHGLEGKFVVMYSGNHSPCHPLDTLLDASRLLRDRPDIVFCFVGGGSEWRKMVEAQSSTLDTHPAPGPVRPSTVNHLSATASATAHQPSTPSSSSTLLCLPYQPLDQLAGSLSAADLHVVVMGNPFVGLVHPCKIYNILSVASPILYIGPAPSHVTEILSELGPGYANGSFRHGDSPGVAEFIRTFAGSPRNSLREPPPEVRKYSKEDLLPKLIDLLQQHGKAAAPLNTHR